MKNKLAGISALLWVLSISIQAADNIRVFSLSADEWSRPRSGAMVAALGTIQAAVIYWDEIADASIVMHYPGEDSGEIWATELHDWLVSLGIPTHAIKRRPGSQSDDEIRLIVGKH